MITAVPPAPQVIILAAGYSSRLGYPKALAQVRSVSLLRRTLAVAAQFAPTRIIVVLPRRAGRLRLEARGFEVVFEVNPHRAEGLSSSVRRGLAKARYAPAVLLLPVDLAALRPRELGRLIARWRATRRRVIARRIGGPEFKAERGALQGGALQGGVPLILPRWLYAQARGVRGDIGLRELVNGLPPQQRVLLDIPSAELDVDTPRDLLAARHRRGGAGG